MLASNLLFRTLTARKISANTILGSNKIIERRLCSVSTASSNIDAVLCPAIFSAAKEGDDDTIDRLLALSRQGAHLTCKEHWRTPLHYAALNGHHKVISDRRSKNIVMDAVPDYLLVLNRP